MIAKDLKDLLAGVPDDYKLEVGKMVALDLGDVGDEAPDAFKMRLDFPLIGVAVGEKDKSLTFIVGGHGAESMAWLVKFGDVEKVNVSKVREGGDA